MQVVCVRVWELLLRKAVERRKLWCSVCLCDWLRLCAFVLFKSSLKLT